MYDLRSATRLYVLDSHKKKIAACSFSPDGRRLATASLEESVVLVWKVGTSFTSFFNPGAPPRQGHGSSEPFKSFPFSVGEDGMSKPSLDACELIFVARQYEHGCHPRKRQIRMVGGTEREVEYQATPSDFQRVNSCSTELSLSTKWHDIWSRRNGSSSSPEVCARHASCCSTSVRGGVERRSLSKHRPCVHCQVDDGYRKYSSVVRRYCKLQAHIIE
jgi:WD40 repeat protein